jgi:phosphate transport system permease protein
MLQLLGNLPISWLLLSALVIIACSAFVAGRLRAERVLAGSLARSHSRPNYHGYYVAMWSAVPATLAALIFGLSVDFLIRWQLERELPLAFSSLTPEELTTYFDAAAMAASLGGYTGSDRVFAAVTNRYVELKGILNGGMLTLLGVLAAVGLVFSRRKISLNFRARSLVDRGLEGALFFCAFIAIATTIGIVLSLIFESVQFFREVPIWDFLFGVRWNAQTSAEFGALPLFFGTLMIALLAMLVAAPIGLFSAIYLSEFASSRMRAIAKPVLEVLAGIPTVVYGFFALLLVAPAIRSAAVWLNETLMALGLASAPVLAAQPTSALAAGIVMGIMIIPFVSSLSDDVINAVPQTLRDGAYALGATHSETIRLVVLPSALPGIIAALLLAVSRAIGETMIVVMAAGQRANITLDPTADLTTITVQIVALMTGETGFDDPKTLSAFALGLVLFIVTLGFNIIALRVVQRYREKYD